MHSICLQEESTKQKSGELIFQEFELIENYKRDHKINTIKIFKRKRGRKHSEKIRHHEKLITIVKKNQIEILEIRILTNKIKYLEYAEQQIQLQRKMVNWRTALREIPRMQQKKLKKTKISNKSQHT